MKRTCLFLICSSMLLFCGCQTSISEHMKAQENIVIETTIDGDTGVDLSSVEKVFAYADVVVVGTIESVSLASYRDGRFLPYSDIVLSCEQTLKGIPVDSMSFSSAGRLVPANKFLEKDPTAKKKDAEIALTSKQIKNGFANVKVTKRPQFAEGKQYVVFLSKSDDGKLTTLGTDYSVLSMSSNTITDFEGKTYTSIN